MDKVTQTPAFQSAIEVVEALSFDEQAILIDIIDKRLKQQRRSELLQEVSSRTRLRKRKCSSRFSCRFDGGVRRLTQLVWSPIFTRSLKRLLRRNPQLRVSIEPIWDLCL